MMTVREVSRRTGVTIRALQYYDRIGLLHPAKVTEAGYRLYDDASLEQLQQILLFRELDFPLKEIARILESPDFDREKALEQQIELLTLRKEHLESLIGLARKIREKGENNMSFEAFDTKKIEEYTEKAKAAWGGTAAYREYEEKSSLRDPSQERDLGRQLMEIFAAFSDVREKGPASPEAQALVKRL